MASKTAAKKPTPAVDGDRLRAFWAAKQGLDGSLDGRPPAAVLAQTGWSRSVGGANPYLALFARCRRHRAQIDAAVAALEICELPSARGCTYVVPASDFALALRAGQGKGDEAEIAIAKKHCGVTDAEVERLCKAVQRALEAGPQDPRELKAAVGEAVRHLGDEGKRRGITTTLPLALGRLQSDGQIRRVPVNGRLDQQRYAYTLWRPSPPSEISEEELGVELARRFFRWTCPATAAQLAWWAGLSVKAAQRAAAALSLVPLAEGDPRLLFPEDRDALLSFALPREARPVLVGSLDNIGHLRRDVAGLLRDGEVPRPLQDRRGSAGASLADLPHHAILDRGRLIGLWEYDAVAGSLVHTTFEEAPPGLAEELRRVEAFVRDELGDARSFSLDSPETRGERLAALRTKPVTKAPRGR
jgi:hypothetical protein